MMKKIGIFIMSLLIMAGSLSTFAGCGGKADLVIWSFTDEVKTMIEEYYKEHDPSTKIEVKLYTFDSITTTLSNAIRTNSNLPDIVALEEKVIRRYIDADIFAPVNDLIGADTAEMYDYTLNSVKDAGGNVMGMAWQATPGAFFYRHSMAKDILGLDTPEKVQEKFSTWDGIIDAAATLKANGDKRVFSSVTAPSRMFYSQRENGWVADGKLSIDSSLTGDGNSLMEVMKKLQTGSGTMDAQNPYINETTEGATGGWYTDMSSDKVFGYFLSSWGLHYQLKKNATNATTNKSTAGDWRIIQGPGTYSDGGTWLCALKASSNLEKAKEIIKFLTCDKDFLSAWADRTGDFVNNKSVMNIKKENHSDEFLGGQNHYAVLYAAAEKIKGNNLTPYDSAINSMFNEQAIDYAKGDDSKAAAIQDFKDGVSGQYTQITIE